MIKKFYLIKKENKTNIHRKKKINLLYFDILIIFCFN